MKKASPRFHSPYCLHCYAPMERIQGASEPCPSCGSPIVKADLSRLWTHERRLHKIESLLKAMVCVAMTIFGALALVWPGAGVSPGQGMALVVPLVVGVLLWDAASITRRRSLYRADILWSIIGWVLGPIALLATLGMAAGEGHREFYGWAGVTVMIMVPAILSPLIRRGWSRWRDNHIAEAQRLIMR